ncbi:NADH:ubiquinone reductase (H(+)-translocating) [Trifolium repens]|nr:NADH:ubiquinone reductase (H(+)-translocating) [Trifolium repens]
MAARSSSEIVQRPFNPVLPPVINLKSQEKLVFKDNVTDAGPESFEFVTEKFVDFESFKVNGIDIQSLFYDQQWKNYFEMLNGFVYYDIVKYFWQKATIFDKFNADEEVRKMVEKDSSLKGKTRTQLGLRPFRGKEIRSNIMGINVLITQEHIAKILGLDNEGENVDEYGEKSKHIESIKKDLFLPGCTNNDFGKAKFMKQNFSFAFKVFLASIITREGGYDTISLPHRHFIWFLYKKVKINLAKLLFDHLCFTISKSRTKSPSMIHHPRLISEIIRQTKLIHIISTKEKLRVFNTAKYDASVLVNMHLKTKEELKTAKSPLEQVYEKYFWCDGFPTISEFDNDDVIKNFLELVRLDSGVSVPRSMVVGVPNWDIFKGPKQVTRSKRKPQPIEQDIVEEEQSEEKNDGAEVGGAERIVTKEKEEVSKEQVAKIAQRKVVQKERRTKKRQDRPENAEEEQPVRATKRKKTVVSKQKAADSGKNSMPNIDSTASAHPSTQSSPIDYTQPIRMIQPSPKSSSSSSSSEETLSDSSIDSTELIAELDKLEKVKKKPVQKHTKRVTKKPIHIASDEEPPIIIDTSILDQPTNTTRKSPTILDHLSTHLSGDAFTHSNTASPDQFHFVNTTSNLPSDPPLPEPQIQSPPSSLADIEQEDPPTFTPAQDEIMTHSDHITTKPPTPQPELSTPEPTPEPQTPSSEPIYGPSYKPLTIEELCLPTDFALPILEDLLKAEINVDDDIITIDPFDKIKRIKIIPLKRKRPEPIIPFNRSQPFFNYNSEPNLELLSSAINVSLRNFKSMEEEVLIFPSDVDAKIRELEKKFSQSLKLLGGYVKRRIEGRGMEALSQIMSAAERSHALRLTFFNHEEECQRLAFLAAVNESIRRSLDDEQARIAAEMEHQRLAEQEAFKLLVDRAVHIAVVETNKIIETQGAVEDIVMNDQNLSELDSDKGKAPIVASSPPRSPPILVQGSSSSAIPSVMQEALDAIKNDLREELRNEMDEFRVDIREDLNRSGEATNKKIDAMMELLLKLTQQQPKP